jgi:O-6-methylguanine DNA methyltransferase
MLTERLDALLTDYFRPRPAHGPADLARRVVRQARGRRDDIERLLSRLAIAATGSGITRIHRGTLRLPARGAARRHIEQARQELAEFFGGRRVYFEVPIDPGPLPRFQTRVLRETARIPFGGARSYSWLARRIGHPGAARAVGTALGRNPVPFIVPCHRVLRDDGTLGGYGLGLPLKKRLLLLERTTPVLEGCTSTRFVCRVGCAALRRTRPDRRVVFASVADAASVGYRPCRLCRPEAGAGC